MKWTAGKKRILLTSAVLISASAAFLFLLAGGGPERETRTFPVMGTVCGIDLYGNSGEILSRAADDAQREIRRLEAMFNIYDPDSELSRLNAAAFHHPFRCSEELWEILQQARKYYVLSDGAFDVTVKPLMKLWGFHRRRSAVPAREEIEAAKKLVGLEKVIFNDAARTVRFSVDGTPRAMRWTRRGRRCCATALTPAFLISAAICSVCRSRSREEAVPPIASESAIRWTRPGS